MQPQQIVCVPQTQILLPQTQHPASRQEIRLHLPMGMYPNTWKEKARHRASSTVSFRWWLLPLCRYSFWVPAVRVRNMWLEESMNSAQEPTSLSSHSTAAPFLKRWRHQNSSVMRRDRLRVLSRTRKVLSRLPTEELSSSMRWET